MMLKHVTVAANLEGKLVVKIESDMVTVSTHFDDQTVFDSGVTVELTFLFDASRILVLTDDADLKLIKLFEKPTDTAEAINENDSRHMTKFHSVRVDIKALSHFLSAQQVAFARLIASIVDGKCLHLLIASDEFNLQYFLPAVLY